MEPQRGFTWLGALIVIVGLLVIGGGAYYLGRQNAAPAAQPNYPDISTLPQTQQQQTSNTSIQATTNTTVQQNQNTQNSNSASNQNSTAANNTSTTASAPKSYCTPDNYSVKDGVVYWGANPLKEADPATFKPLPPFPQDGGYDLCLSEDATHAFTQDRLAPGPHPDHIQYLPLLGTKNCDRYRVVDGLGVFEGTWPLAGADVSTFRDITPPDGKEEGMCYGKDKYGVFSSTGFGGISGADTKTFQVLNANYTRDAQHVWYRGGLYDNYGAMPTADVSTFVVLSETYAKDANHAYHMERVVSGADPTTFAALDDNHSKDSVHVYNSFGEPYSGIDGKTAISLDGGVWLKDAMHVYWSDGTLVPQANAQTFVGLGGGYGKDANHVFYNNGVNFGTGGNVVDGADLPTFTVADRYAKDGTHIFSAGKILPDASVATFQRIGSSVYFKDANHVWYQSLSLVEISGADPNTFTLTDQDGGAKDAHHIYGFDPKGRFYGYGQ